MNNLLNQIEVTYTDFEKQLEDVGLQLLKNLKDSKKVSITCDEDDMWLYYCLCYLEITINNNKVIHSGREKSIVGKGPWRIVNDADAVVVFTLKKGNKNFVELIDLDEESKNKLNIKDKKSYQVNMNYETMKQDFYTEFGCYFWNELTSIKKAKQLGLNVCL